MELETVSQLELIKKVIDEAVLIDSKYDKLLSDLEIYQLKCMSSTVNFFLYRLKHFKDLDDGSK